MSTSDPTWPENAEILSDSFDRTSDQAAEEAPVIAVAVDDTAEAEPSVEPPPMAMKVHPDPGQAQRSANLTLIRLSTWTLITATLVALVALPYVAERVQYAVTRGDQRAKAEVARELLAQFPEAVSRRTYVAHSIAPSVVGIETAQVSQDTPTEEAEFLFGIPRFRKEGIGSGVIVDPAGYIVTNNHVIDQASEITIKLSDGTPIRDVRVVGRDPLTDLAVLKIEGGHFVPAPWGDSSVLEAGDAVLAVGNPYGLDRTVTSGIISATGRRARISKLAHQDFLQTDAEVTVRSSP
jgi:serine protease Do